MRAIILAIAATVAVGAISPALAQGHTRATMEAMKAKDPQGYSACQTLASSRGYRVGQSNDYENQALMSFIEGCMMGRVR
jgi:hypothetical protein